MYEQFYDLRERPFDLTPDPRYLLLTPTHAEGLSTLEYGVKARKGIVVLIGDAGTGKTTIVRAARASLGKRGRVVLLNNPTLTPAEFEKRFGWKNSTRRKSFRNSRKSSGSRI